MIHVGLTDTSYVLKTVLTVFGFAAMTTFGFDEPGNVLKDYEFNDPTGIWNAKNPVRGQIEPSRCIILKDTVGNLFVKHSTLRLRHGTFFRSVIGLQRTAKAMLRADSHLTVLSMWLRVIRRPLSPLMR